ncbi:MAG: hypothetical protein J6N78_06250 [Clostridia bacterium]|nr:hypothetical protein [Clostridia bacterium]
MTFSRMMESMQFSLYGKSDFVYQKFNKDNMVFIYGVVGNNSVELKSIIAI